MHSRSVVSIMLLRIAATLFVMLFAVRVGHSQAVTPAYPPSSKPDRIVLTWTADPARSMTVTWRTSPSVSAMAQIAPAESGPSLSRKSRSAAAVSKPLTMDRVLADFHTATFENLEPGTKYCYRVGDGTTWSEWLMFETASEQPESFSFVFLGDAQNDLKKHWSRVVREAYRTAPNARFFLHGGDLVNLGTVDYEWGEWFEAGGWIHSTIPVLPLPGNHEYWTGLTPMWKTQFPLPQNGPKGMQDSVFFVDCQGVRIICLDSNEKHADQTDWLENALATSPAKWNIVAFHHPIVGFGESSTAGQLWRPILDRHRVDLVLQGHEHIYARSGLMGNGVYVTSVSGPKMYPLRKADWMRRSAQGVQLFQVIRIDGDQLKYEARTATGELFDGFELRRTSKGKNALTESPQFEYPSSVDGPIGISDDLSFVPPTAPTPAVPPEGSSRLAVTMIAVLAGLLLLLTANRRRKR